MSDWKIPTDLQWKNCFDDSSVFIFEWIFFILAGFKGNHSFLDDFELVSKVNVGLKSLLHLGLSEPEFYGDLVYKFKKKLRV